MVVSVGETFRVPEDATEPIPWSKLTLAALVVLQLNVLDGTADIDAGKTLSVALGGTGGSAAIGHTRPTIPGLVVAVQVGGGRGNTSESGW